MINMDAIEKIHEFEKFGSILGLERISKLMELLGNPQDELKFIHIAGTNGKGSVSRYIYNILEEAGYKTGVYTSPFIEKFNERIEFDRKHITNEELDEYTDKVMAAVDEMVRGGIESPTEFEVITAVAFLYYRDKKADYVVLEVGLGGRLDATNIIKNPLATVIASISFDHTGILGNTLSLIAGEKAGIIKEGCPVITSAKSDEALVVIEKKAEEAKAMYFETRNIPCNITKREISGYTFDCDIQGVEFKNIEISMIGDYQVENAILALTTINILEENGDISVTREQLYRGLKVATNIARFEMVSEEPLIIIDGAHNPDGARALNETVNNLLKGKRVLVLVGMLADKDTRAALSEFIKFGSDFVVTEVPNPRKMSAKDLAAEISVLGGNCVIEPEFKKAVLLAKKLLTDYDALICCGSLYLMGAIRPLLR